MLLGELFEGRDYPLYHGTSLFAAVQILKENTFKDTTTHSLNRLNGLGGSEYDKDVWQTGKVVSGVSLTRSKEKALHFDFGEITFELDHRKLSQRHKIIPFDYWAAGRLDKPSLRGHNPYPKADSYEYEEFCVGKIQPADRYITKIYMAKRNYYFNTRFPEKKELTQFLEQNPLFTLL